MAKKPSKVLSPQQSKDLLAVLEQRFVENMARHKKVDWAKVLAELKAHPAALWSLNEMELTGGEPDVVLLDNQPGGLSFVDCAAESPAGRRSLCFDREGLKSRKSNQPEGTALDMAAAMGAELLTETQYRALQKFGPFDTKTSSWIQTPPAVRALGGALFCDHRYGQVFVYHNGASSYFAARGFRGVLLV